MPFVPGQDGDLVEAKDPPRAASDALPASDAMAVDDRRPPPGMAADVDGDRAVEGANPALDAANRLGHDLRRSQCLAAGCLSLEQASEHVLGVWGKRAPHFTAIRGNSPGRSLPRRDGGASGPCPIRRCALLARAPVGWGADPGVPMDYLCDRSVLGRGNDGRSLWERGPGRGSLHCKPTVEASWRTVPHNRSENTRDRPLSRSGARCIGPPKRGTDGRPCVRRSGVRG